MVDLDEVTAHFALAWQTADAKKPLHPRYGKNGYGIGPFEEKSFMRMLHAELAQMQPAIYALPSRLEVNYPNSTQTADLGIAGPDGWEWIIELKYARMKRSDGVPEEAALSRVLSPYRESAIVDCLKLLTFTETKRRAVTIVGYDYDDLPVEPLISDFESLASRRVRLGIRYSAGFAAVNDADHSIHRRGIVCAWEISALGA